MHPKAARFCSNACRSEREPTSEVQEFQVTNSMFSDVDATPRYMCQSCQYTSHNTGSKTCKTTTRLNECSDTRVIGHSLNPFEGLIIYEANRTYCDQHSRDNILRKSEKGCRRGEDGVCCCVVHEPGFDADRGSHVHRASIPASR